MHFDTLILYKIKNLSSVKLETRAGTGLVVVSIDGSLTCPDVFPVIRKLAWVQDVGDLYIYKHVYVDERCQLEDYLVNSIPSLLQWHSLSAENEYWFPMYQKFNKAGFAYYKEVESSIPNTAGVINTKGFRKNNFSSLEEAFSEYKEDAWKNIIPCAVERIPHTSEEGQGDIYFQEHGSIDSYLDALSSFSPPNVDCLLIQASNNTDWFLYCYEDR